MTPLKNRQLRRRSVQYSKTPPKGIWEYAHDKNVSVDGCSTKQDVDCRREMLNHVARGWDDGHLRLPPDWVFWA